MNVLILNCGSSSQGFKLYARTPGQEPAVVIAGKAHNVATETQQAPFVQWTWAGDDGDSGSMISRPTRVLPRRSSTSCRTRVSG